MNKELTCIVCPLGCTLTVDDSDKENINVCGNTCPRGREYAIREMTAPVRVVTSTVRCENGEMMSVKTDRPIPKDKMSECMKIINNCIVPLPICPGDVIIENIYGANVVATGRKD